MEPVTFSSARPRETRGLGEALGRVLQDGDFVGLEGELGAGKTEFARGLAKGAGGSGRGGGEPYLRHRPRLPRAAFRWPTPTCYRLTDSDDLYGTGYHELRDGPGAMAVEWLDRFPDAAPPRCASRSLQQSPGDGCARSTASRRETRSRHLARALAGRAARPGGVSRASGQLPAATWRASSPAPAPPPGPPAPPCWMGRSRGHPASASVRSCIGPGLLAMVAAAAARLAAPASRSPSALVMVARFSRSGRGLPRHHPLQVLRHVDIQQPDGIDVGAPGGGAALHHPGRSFPGSGRAR